MKSHGTCIAAVLLYSCLAASVSGDEAVSVRSPSRHFLVTCSEGGQSISVARWADDVLNKLERTIRSRMDFKNRDFRIKIFDGSGTSSGRVGCSERFSEGKLDQSLLIESPDKVDWEDILELNCGLLLNGQIAVGASALRQRPVGKVPAWLVVGLSHYIDPVLKSRDRRIVLNWRKSGKVPGFSEVLKWYVLPAGRSREKAVCTVAVAWLLTLPDAEERFDKIQAQLAVDGVISDEWIVSLIPDCKTVDDVQKLWLNRIENERMVISDPGQVFPDALESIKGELVICPGEGGVPSGTNLPPVIGLEALIGMKNLEWIRPFCMNKSTAIRLASVGGSSEVREVGEAYCAFMDVLRTSGRDNKLRSLLARADDMIQKLESITRKREEYMDGMEQKQASANPLQGSEENSSPDSLERSRIRKYIDAADEESQAGGADGDLTGVGAEGTR